MAKSFHLRNLYQEHGIKERTHAYRFFLNLYDYEEREAVIVGKTKTDKLSGEYLNNQQKVFRCYDYETQQTSY